VGTWNIQNLVRSHKQFKKLESENPSLYADLMKIPRKTDAQMQAIATEVRRIDADILGVQEVLDPGALKEISDLLDGDWVAASSWSVDRPRSNTGFLIKKGLPVYARVEWGSQDIRWISPDLGVSRVLFPGGLPILLLSKEPGGSPSLAVFNHHAKAPSFGEDANDFAFWRKGQNEKLVEIKDTLRRRFGKTLPILGTIDANAKIHWGLAANSETVPLVDHFADSFEVGLAERQPIHRISYRFPARGNTAALSAQMDAILVATGSNLRVFDTKAFQIDPKISDHRPVVSYVDSRFLLVSSHIKPKAAGTGGGGK
jgi:hypothetical protein